MSPTRIYRLREAADFPRWTFPTLEGDYDIRSRSVWMYFKADGDPYFSMQTLSDMADFRESLRNLFASETITRNPVSYVVMASRMPGVFNLGGDLALFSRCIRNHERSVLRAYAHACVDVVYGMTNA